MIKEMQVVNTKMGNVKDGGTRLVCFELESNLAAADTGDIILVPSDINSVSVTVSFTGGASGYVEATTDTLERIKNGTAEYVVWNSGVESDGSEDEIYKSQ
jgi:hypothetical protein